MSIALSNLPQSLKQFLEKETVCSLAVKLPDGGIHVAQLRYIYDAETLNFYMSTAKGSEKMASFRRGDKDIQAAIAVGTDKKLPYLFQLRGTLRIFERSDNEHIYDRYMQISHPLDDPRKPDNSMIILKPSWIRYSDWTTFDVVEVDL